MMRNNFFVHDLYGHHFCLEELCIYNWESHVENFSYLTGETILHPLIVRISVIFLLIDT